MAKHPSPRMTTSATSTIASKTSLIEKGNLRFLIMDSPKPDNLHLYLKECEKHHVTHIVRISEPEYSRNEVEQAGIKLHVNLRKILISIFYISFYKGNAIS